MRNTVIILIVLWISLAFGCGRSGDVPQAGEAAAAANPGQKPGEKPQNAAEIDVDKLNIPDKLKQEIKSGRIPKEKIPEILASIRGGAGADQGEAYPVSVGPVLRKNLNSYLVLNGVVEPERKVEVYSRLAAYVKQILKEEGDYVKESDILALLDDTEIRSATNRPRSNWSMPG